MPKAEQGDFSVLYVSDDRAKIVKPHWYKKDDRGYMIHSIVGKLEIVFKASVDGKINFWLRGMWVPNPKDKSKNVPYWIDYTKFTINEKVIFDTLTPTWHDEPYVYQMDVKSGEEIKINVEWQPHRSNTDATKQE